MIEKSEITAEEAMQSQTSYKKEVENAKEGFGSSNMSVGHKNDRREGSKNWQDTNHNFDEAQKNTKTHIQRFNCKRSGHFQISMQV